MDKFTKGPWVADKYGMGVDTECKDLPLLRTHGLGCDNTHICTMDDGEYVEYADHGEMRANANLIAAAPELYDVLKAFCEYTEKDNDGVSLLDNDRLWEKAMEVLGKAEGEKS